MLPVAILAGGIGTRLRPLTEKVPKALVEVNGEPFLAHQLRLLRGHGVERVVICAGYLGGMIRDFAGEGSAFGLHVDYSWDGPVLRGTAGALRNALPLLGEAFLVVYGDSYLPCDYQAVEQAFLASGKLALMTVFHNQGRWDTSNVEFDGERILAYDKKNRTPRMHYIDYGLGAFHAAAFDGAAEDLASVYQNQLTRGQLAGFDVPQRFYEIGSFEGLRSLEEFLS
jgi:NDP-sugar pyrophosphorylase family protein